MGSVSLRVHEELAEISAFSLHHVVGGGFALDQVLGFRDQ
jgi:hypothetical protein